MLPTNAGTAVDVASSSPNLVAGLRQNARTIVLVAALVTFVAVGVSIVQPPRYTSAASVVLQDSSDTGAAPNMATEKQIATSSAVSDRAVQSLHLRVTPEEASKGLSVSVPVDASVLVFSYTSGDPRSAQHFAQAYADAYLSYRHDAQLHAIQSANDVADVRIAELQNELQAVTKKQDAATTHSEVEAYRVTANALVAQIGVEETRAATAAGNISAVGDRLVAAALPTGPSQPKLVLNGLLGLFLGLSLGTFVALWQASFKRRVQTEEDVREMLDMPLLAVIPQSRRGTPSPSIITSGEQSPTTDAYREVIAKLLSSPLLSSSNGHHPGAIVTSRSARTIAVVPLEEGADATEVAANVGAAVALSGRSVLHVSTTVADGMTPLLGPDGGPGLTDVMRGDSGLTEAIRPTSVGGLRVLPKGEEDGSWMLLDATSVHRTVDEVSALADLVVVPAPAASSAGVGASAIVAACDAVLYVGVLGSTNADEARRVRSALDPLGKQTLGAVMFERAPARRSRKGGTWWSRRRGPSPDAPRKPRVKRDAAVGDPPRWKALRHVVRSRISEHPSLYLPLARRRYPGPSPKVVADDTELVIDGYTRSACTFAVYAFQLAQQSPRPAPRKSSRGSGPGRTPQPVRIAHHVHAAAQLLEAARRGIPTIVVIREPEGAILSQLLQEPHVSMRDALISYQRFYSILLPHGPRFVAGEFREVTTDFGAVIHHVNQRFHTRFRRFDPTDENTQRCLDLMKERPTTDPQWRELVLGFESGTVPLAKLLAGRARRNGDSPAVTDTWIPSKDRAQAKEALLERWNAPELAPLREAALAAYHDFLRATADGEDR